MSRAGPDEVLVISSFDTTLAVRHRNGTPRLQARLRVRDSENPGEAKAEET